MKMMIPGASLLSLIIWLALCRVLWNFVLIDWKNWTLGGDVRGFLLKSTIWLGFCWRKRRGAIIYNSYKSLG